MPDKMSMEVVKHSDKDYRLIFKSDNNISRKSFDSVNDLMRFVFFRIMSSSVFEKTTFRIHFGK